MTQLLKDKTVFIVEDNVQNRIIFQMILISQGAHSEFERWGKNAVSRLQALRHVDLIILDLMLANQASGFDVFNQIRALPQYQPIPIIAVSAADPLTAIPLAKSKGFAGFIAKPVDDVQFPKQLCKVLAGEMVWDYGLGQNNNI